MSEYVKNAEGVIIGTFHPLKTKTRWAWMLALYPIFSVVLYLVLASFMNDVRSIWALSFLGTCVYLRNVFVSDRNIVVARGTKDTLFFWYLVPIALLPIIGIPV